MRTRAPWLALAASLLAAGCVSVATLQPLPSTPTTQAGSAIAEAAGVRLVADGDAWRGTPSDLERIVTPVRVRLENQSGRPLRIDYESFTLLGSSHFEYAAISPFALSDKGTAAVGGSGTTQGAVALGVSVGHRRGWGPRAFGWGGPWSPGWYGSWYDPFFGPGFYDPFWGPYSSWYARPPPEPLPTRDMLRNALPEGTLDTGGTLTGFLYFQNVSEREGSVTLQARLVDARTGEQFGTLSIPFGVRS